MAEVLPIIIYLLLIVLLVVLIILGIKLIITTNKVDDLVDDVNKKVRSLDRLFEIVDFTTDRISMATDIVVNFVSSKLKGLFGKKKNKKFKKEEYDE
ncbi:MAG: hypothetical protein IJB83_05425 [Bacilli bacterium]|nr:hypothetical protein [Bacilli bacterium]